MRKQIAGISCLMALSMGAATGATAADTGWYGGLGLGRSFADPPGIGTATDDRDNAWKAFGGYQFNRYFGVEGGYVDLGSSASFGGPGNSARFDSQAWHATAVGSLPINPQFALTGKLGFARTETDASGVRGGIPIGGTDNHTGPTYGLGLRYDFTQHVGIRGDWDRYRVGGGGFGDTSDTDVYSVSAVFRF